MDDTITCPICLDVKPIHDLIDLKCCKESKYCKSCLEEWLNTSGKSTCIFCSKAYQTEDSKVKYLILLIPCLITYLLIYGTLLSHPCTERGWAYGGITRECNGIITFHHTYMNTCYKVDMYYYVLSFIKTLGIIIVTLVLSNMLSPFLYMAQFILFFDNDPRFYKGLYDHSLAFQHLIKWDIDYRYSDAHKCIGTCIIVLYPLMVMLIIQYYKAKRTIKIKLQ